MSHRNVDNWNAIDPNVIVGDNGRVWMTYGSFWDGIQLVELSADDMQTPLSEPVTIARRKAVGVPQLAEFHAEKGVDAGDNAIEAPFIYRRDGYYYLFVSHDYCCRAKNRPIRPCMDAQKTFKARIMIRTVAAWTSAVAHTCLARMIKALVSVIARFMISTAVQCFSPMPTTKQAMASRGCL